jgi:hypothetical protein
VTVLDRILVAVALATALWWALSRRGRANHAAHAQTCTNAVA